MRVWAPNHRAGAGTALTVPPCVYYGMEKTIEAQAWRSDCVDCFDRVSNQWYEVTLPEGPYWTEFEPVMFWDMNHDGPPAMLASIISRLPGNSLLFSKPDLPPPWSRDRHASGAQSRPGDPDWRLSGARPSGCHELSDFRQAL